MKFKKVTHVDFYSLPIDIRNKLEKHTNQMCWTYSNIPLSWFYDIPEISSYVFSNLPDSEQGSIVIDWEM